jgi:hypothetical protein
MPRTSCRYRVVTNRNAPNPHKAKSAIRIAALNDTLRNRRSSSHRVDPARFVAEDAQRAEHGDVTARLAELQEHLKLIDHKIDVYRGRLAAGDADRLWAPQAPNA